MKRMQRAAIASSAASFVATLVAQELQSGPLARELTTLMTRQRLGAIAAKDPESPDRFVAALAFPDVQLLVVSARYAAPLVLEDQIGKRQYNDVYAALQRSSVPESKVFFQDLKADGLHAKSDGGVDVMYEHVVHQTIVDGNPAKQKLTAAAYAEKLADADARYSRLLSLLIAEVKSHSVVPADRPASAMIALIARAVGIQTTLHPLAARAGLGAGDRYRTAS
jgi:hypothetical protein